MASHTLSEVPWEPKDFIERVTKLIEGSEADELRNDQLSEIYSDAASQIVDANVEDLASTLADRRSIQAGFRIRLQARWHRPLDLLELLLDMCQEIGGGAIEHYRPTATERQDARFEALVRLHGKATLTASEVLVLLQTGHAMGAMGRWRTLHEVDVVAAFLSQQPDEIAYRFLRYADAQTLKARRAYDRYHEDLGYEPSDLTADGDPKELKRSLVKEFGDEFLLRNGWAVPTFGHRPTDSELEEAVEMDHYRPYYYLASDSVHATPKGLMGTLQQIGDVQTVMAGPSNAGLADPGHGAALSLARCTITLTHYCAFELLQGAPVDESMSTILTTHTLLELCDRIGESFGRAHLRLLEEEGSKDRDDTASTELDPQ